MTQIKLKIDGNYGKGSEVSEGIIEDIRFRTAIVGLDCYESINTVIPSHFITNRSMVISLISGLKDTK